MHHEKKQKSRQGGVLVAIFSHLTSGTEVTV